MATATSIKKADVNRFLIVKTFAEDIRFLLEIGRASLCSNPLCRCEFHTAGHIQNWEIITTSMPQELCLSAAKNLFIMPERRFFQVIDNSQ
jgi:hypothetical protein